MKKENTNKLPPEIKLFLIKSVIAFVGWQALYRLVLLPARIPDRFLTNITATVTAKVVSLFTSNVQTTLNTFKVIISINGKKVIGIADPCNALEIFVLYIAFLFCFPAPARLRLRYLLIGIPLVFAANIVRCCLLVWLNIKHPGWFDISHHYIFTALVYLLVFYLWLSFTKHAKNIPKA